MDLYDELLGLVDVLHKHQIEYALCGGVAVTIHGHTRSTKDIDLLIEAKDLDAVREAVKERGFLLDSGKLPFGTGTPEKREVHRILKIAARETLTLDLVIVTPVLRDVWQGRGVFAWAGRQIKVVSLEGLAKMKRLAGRKQDLADLEGLGLGEDKDDSEEIGEEAPS